MLPFATLNTDTEPFLIAVAAGQVTLTATVQSAATEVQVNIVSGANLVSRQCGGLPHSISGLRTWQILQAVPRLQNTSDFYTHEADSSGNAIIRAFTADGAQLWQSSGLGWIDLFGMLPDGLGGISATSVHGLPPFSYSTLSDFDGVTGAQMWSYTSSGLISGQATRQDGVKFFLEETTTGPSQFDSNLASLVALSPDTGAEVMRFPLPRGLAQTYDCNGVLIQDRNELPA